jgi:hypothetical protein
MTWHIGSGDSDYNRVWCVSNPRLYIGFQDYTNHTSSIATMHSHIDTPTYPHTYNLTFTECNESDIVYISKYHNLNI